MPWKVIGSEWSSQTFATGPGGDSLRVVDGDERAIARAVGAQAEHVAVVFAGAVRHEHWLGRALRCRQRVSVERAGREIELAEAAEIVEREIRERVRAALDAGSDRRELAAVIEDALVGERTSGEIDRRPVIAAVRERVLAGAGHHAADLVERIEARVPDVVDDDAAALVVRIREVPLVERVGVDSHGLARAVDRHAR